MKEFRICYFWLMAYSAMFTSQALANDSMSWRHDGTIYNSVKDHIKLDLQNIYSGLEYESTLFVIGYKIDHSGINYPTVARISANLESPKYWSFQQDLQDVFVYQKAVYISDAGGQVFVYKPPNWAPSNITLKPDSKIVYANDDLVACYPSSLLKSSMRIGACYSLSIGWLVKVNWQTVTPKTCNGKLFTFEQNNGRKLVRVMNLRDGKALFEKTVESPPTDLCSVRF